MKSNEDLPKDCYRGITSLANIITKEEFLSKGAFHFGDYDAESRNDDGYCEMSINWNDDEGSLIVLKNQHKPGNSERQFKAGYCYIEEECLKRLRCSYGKENFDFERKVIEEDKDADIQANPYHGNLLLGKDVPKPLRNLIESALAMFSTKLHHWDD